MATAKWEHLICKIGDHKWKRELGKRGRKPEFCPKHKPAVSVPGNQELHCELGNHSWIREPTRGRIPSSCPEHKTHTVITAAPRNENGKVTLHCEAGNHDWERLPQKGRKPSNCPDHSGPRVVPVSVVAGSESGDPVPKKRGRPRIHDSKEAQEEAQLRKSRERAANLDEMLKANGSHISQNYILFKKTGEKASRRENVPPTVTWERVTAHTALQSAQYVNAHEAEFKAGNYRYEHEGKILDLV
jgi:hypothetical protein